MSDKLYIGYETGYVLCCYNGKCENFFTLYSVANSYDEAFAKLKKCAYENVDIKLTRDNYVDEGCSWNVIEVANKPYLGCAFNGGGDGNLEPRTFDTKKELSYWLWIRILGSRMYEDCWTEVKTTYSYVGKSDASVSSSDVEAWLQFANDILPEGDRIPVGDSVYWYTLNSVVDVGEWRPRKAASYPRPYRDAMRVLMLLAKTINM